MNKIIYSMRVMTQLVELGFKPSYTMPNPAHPQYNCWVFERNEQFDKAFYKLMGVTDDELS